MSRCLLHKTKLDAFQQWLSTQGIEVRPGRGDFEVLQVKLGQCHRAGPSPWHCVFDRIEAPEHYTVAWPLEQLVRRFIKETR